MLCDPSLARIWQRISDEDKNKLKFLETLEGDVSRFTKSLRMQTLSLRNPVFPGTVLLENNFENHTTILSIVGFILSAKDKKIDMVMTMQSFHSDLRRRICIMRDFPDYRVVAGIGRPNKKNPVLLLTFRRTRYGNPRKCSIC